MLNCEFLATSGTKSKSNQLQRGKKKAQIEEQIKEPSKWKSIKKEAKNERKSLAEKKQQDFDLNTQEKRSVEDGRIHRVI